MRATVLSAIALIAIACLSQAYAKPPRFQYKQVCGWHNACVYTNQTTGQQEMCWFPWYPFDIWGERLHCLCQHPGKRPPDWGITYTDMYFPC
jgi:hypothetical protein